MRYVIAIALMFLIVPGAVSARTQAKERNIASGHPDCSSRSIRYQKAQATYGDLILEQWACATLVDVPFEQRDSNPSVKACMRQMVMYKQVGAKKDMYCIRLDDAREQTQYFMIVTNINGVHTPFYQSTRASNDGA